MYLTRLWVQREGPQNRMYNSLHCNASFNAMCFDDFPVPRDWSEFPSHWEIAEYYQAAARHYGVDKMYRFGIHVERWEETETILVIHLSILVERDGQRAIVIGHGGERLKQVGIDARREVETLLDRRVRLELWVKVRGGWSDDDRMLRRLGLSE